MTRCTGRGGEWSKRKRNGGKLGEIGHEGRREGRGRRKIRRYRRRKEIEKGRGILLKVKMADRVG